MRLPPIGQNAFKAEEPASHLFVQQQEDAAERLAAIVESSDDAIIGKDLNGIITSWNEGARRIFGYEAAEIIGQPVTTLIPPDHHNEEPSILARVRRGERVDHYETIRRRKDGSLIDISLTISPVKNAQGHIVGASKIARDITGRKRAERLLQRQTLRLERLNHVAKMIARDLDLDRTVQTVTDIATELTGAKFGAFFYNAMDPSGENYVLFGVSGAPRDAVERFGVPRNEQMFDATFKDSKVVRSDDIRCDSRYAYEGTHCNLLDELSVVSYLAVPVIGRTGDVLGGLFFGHDQPGIFSQEAEDIATGIAGHAAIAIDNARLHRTVQDELAQRRRAEDAKELLLHEIQHRVKNTLGTVLAIAGQTFRRAPVEERNVFAARIQALAEAHALLTQNDGNRAELRDVVEHALAPFRETSRDRFHVSGPDTSLEAGKSLTLAMVLHELGTNAVKYGALSNDMGTIALDWEIRDGEHDQTLKLVWQEKGGPPVSPPEHKGFGSTLIERALDGNRGKAQLEYATSGVVCLLEIVV
ncbi:MAG TPA: PAS domain S-box protein [Micropepsaceae bacterium]|nr:PAS domain S-box protein [Micropepsaceae bacterium]